MLYESTRLIFSLKCTPLAVDWGFSPVLHEKEAMNVKTNHNYKMLDFFLFCQGFNQTLIEKELSFTNFVLKTFSKNTLFSFL